MRRPGWIAIALFVASPGCKPSEPTTASAEPDFPKEALVEMEDIDTCIEAGLLERGADPAAFDASVDCMLGADDLATVAACLGPAV